MNRLLTLALTLCLTACSGSDDTRDLQHYIEQLKQQTSFKTSLLDTIHFRKQTDLTGPLMHSPFPQSSANINAALLTKAPIERYPIDALHLLGIVQQGDEAFIVMQTPDNKTYQLHRGDSVGNQLGKITAISSDQVTLVEPADPANGLIEPRTYTLRLKGS